MTLPFLLIETSTERSIVAIMEPKEILYHKELPFGLSNSKFLAPSIEEGLCALNMSLSDVSYIAVGIGPGSYTGIRVGVMLAKTLAFAANKPLIGVCTLKCFAPENPGSFLVLVDARIGGVYSVGGIMDLTRNISYTIEPQVVPLDQLPPLLKDRQWIVTPETKVLKPKLESYCPDAEWQQLPPDPLQMARVVEEQFLQGNIALEGSLELMYLRKTQAEIEKESRKESP